MLIYHYFNSLDGLITAYIQQHDYWINFDEQLPDKEHIGEFIKEIFKRQIAMLRQGYTLRRLYRWELTSNNTFIKELWEKREAKGVWLADTVGKLSKHPQKETAAMASIFTAAISYPSLLEEECSIFNGINIQTEDG
ncbi:hypothetical protein BANORC5_21930 [Bacteroides nordii]|nr:hypothetical protein BANORC5_21930 [Bacteroides nordii]